MKCTSCGAVNLDGNKFCLQCGKPLKDQVALPIEPDTSLVENMVQEGEKIVSAHNSIEDAGTHTIIANAETSAKENAPTSSEDAVPLPELTQVEKPAAAGVQEDPPTITNEPTLLTQPISVSEESHPVREEVSAQIQSAAPIEQELTQISTQTTPEVPTQEEATIGKPLADVIPQDPIIATAPPSDVSQPDAPAIADIPQMPIPNQLPPMYPGTPSDPGYPVPEGTYPSAPGYPTYPPAPFPDVSQPGMSGQYLPINAYQPGMSGEFPPMREYPPISASLANQATQPTVPGYSYPPAVAQPQTVQQPAVPKQIAGIAKPLPIWILVVGIIATLAILTVLQLTGSDWADGAMRAAIGAISIAVLLLLFAGTRIFLGMLNEANKKRVVQSIGSALAIVLLFGYSGLALLGQNLLHTAQAHFLEGQQQWQEAINEYQLGGETAPSSTDLARTYRKWGEALNKSGDYAGAISKFDVVINTYTSVDDEVALAQKDEIDSYLNLGEQAARKNDYVSATQNFDRALGLSFCNVDCQRKVRPEDATAYYNLAQSELNTQQYDKAVADFKTLQSRFPDSPEAQKVHGPLATALLGLGKQERANVCSSAIPTYQDLAKNYSDTPEGQDAANELSQPQPVMGRFTSTLPTDGVLTAVLTTTPLNGNMSASEFGSIILNSSITASINGDGTFKFDPQQQGTYDLAWIDATPSVIYFAFYYKVTDPAKPDAYVANVGPLCPFDFGNISVALNV